MIGNKVRELREAQYMTQEQLSELSGVSIARLSAIESGAGKWHRQDLQRVADQLGTTTDALIDDEAEISDDPHADELARQVGRRIKKLRGLLELDQTPFAQQAGISQPRLSHYETGLRILSLKVALALCDTYRVSLDWLYRGDVSGLPHWMAIKLND